MTRDEAKNLLLLYRSEADLADQQIAEAVTLAQASPDLRRWFEEHCARQKALREKIRQIPVPAGLKEQIIYEQAAQAKARAQREKITLVAAVAAIIVALAVLAVSGLPHRQPALANTLAHFQSAMISYATSSYGMDVATNDLQQIQNYLARHDAPADYHLPAPLEQMPATGCAIKDWFGAKVSMICFRTGKPLPPNTPGDLWLFVVERTAVKDAPDSGPPRISRINNVSVATWIQNGKLYLLGTPGDETAIQKFL